ncbi:cell wall manno cis3 [Fusarium longipes]|uniref:Cell wall manno cis3 n=1 Tax=Fusarium longipes TaxID=694270 RepID=A0A395SKG6_9HYPO|nr:cell wall manno cis3 [Fusarium longipes]
MRRSLALLAFAATAFAIPQAVTEDISPKDGPPKGCTTSYSGQFEVTIFKPGKDKRAIEEKRSCNGEGVLVLNLKDGVLKDAQGRTGYISDSYQFQFDKPAQSGAIYTSGFSVCSNGTLALGPSAIFWQCQSGDFYNLYDRNWAEQCEPVEFGVMPCGKGSSSKSAPKKRIVGSSVVATTVVTVVSDGTTKEVPTTIAVPMCQIGDGQVQVRTTPCDDMELPIITAPPVSQVSDGKLQVPTTAPPAPPAVQPENKPGEAGKPEGDAPGSGGSPGGDEPKGASDGSGGKSGEDSQPGASPAGNSAPENTGAASQNCADSNEGSCARPQGSAGRSGKAKPTATDEEVLATDSGSPSATDDTERTGTSRSSSTGAVKPFLSQSTGNDAAEETGSSSGAGSDEKSSSDAAQSDALRVTVRLGMVFVSGVLGSLLVL